jgi:hypothetical protein
VQSSSSLAVRRHRLNFYLVLRKLIAKLQAFSQRIQETPMVRFYLSIYSDDIPFVRRWLKAGPPGTVCSAPMSLQATSSHVPMISFEIDLAHSWLQHKDRARSTLAKRLSFLATVIVALDCSRAER